jgi:hydrogenase nickel incorporation protein HypA/HybF
MHELGIMESTLELAMREVERHQAKTVQTITLRIGELTAVETDALRFAFEALKPGTPMENARLVVEAVPGRALCKACSHEFATGANGFLGCPQCGAYTGCLTAGREIELARLELDQ